MDFQAAVFDLDGTLLNSMDVWEKIDIDFLTKRGLPVPENYITEICARSFKESAEYTIELFGLSESVEAIIKEWNRMAAYEYASNVCLMPYTLDYLLRLKADNIKLAVATGLPEELYKPCLLNNGVYGLFDILCSTDQVKRGKEYPDIFLFAADGLKVSPQKCIVFEDVLPAIKSAKRAGMIAYGVYDKYSAHNQSEIKAIADGYLYDFRKAPLPQKEM
jgi:HAD superfamily hydrolase (TIGR01509 family)